MHTAASPAGLSASALVALPLILFVESGRSLVAGIKNTLGQTTALTARITKVLGFYLMVLVVLQADYKLLKHRDIALEH